MTLTLIIIGIVFTIGAILLAAELFTNAVEWVGRRFKLSQGIVGSVLAAVGTAMPETLVAVVAIVLGSMGKVQGGHEIGTGAILGAPFMLATIAFFITGLAFFISRRYKRRTSEFFVDMNVVAKDLIYFIIAYVIAISLGLVKHYFFPQGGLMHTVDVCAAIALMAIYIIYVTKQANTGGTMEGWDISPLHLQRKVVGDPRRRWMFLQLFLALVLMFIGSQFFVKEVQALAVIIAIPPLVLALLLVPLATELPEKFNSVLWVSRGRDTLAMGNISGAMVMQATFPVSIGLLFTNWSFSLVSLEMLSALMALVSAGIMLVGWKITGKLSPALLMIGGLFYAIYIVAVVLFQGHS
jgi:cation:H+ antiporter